HRQPLLSRRRAAVGTARPRHERQPGDRRRHAPLRGKRHDCGRQQRPHRPTHERHSADYCQAKARKPAGESRQQSGFQFLARAAVLELMING
nr:hypothetical protein [Tanacetum cinerariifolium]